MNAVNNGGAVYIVRDYFDPDAIYASVQIGHDYTNSQYVIYEYFVNPSTHNISITRYSADASIEYPRIGNCGTPK